jgi:hypothetical protein
MTSCPPILAPESLPCSGRGTCVSVTVCLCEDGWTGAGDYVFQEPTCAIHITTVRVLWALASVVEFVCLIFTIKLAFDRRGPRNGNKQIKQPITHFYFIVFSMIHNITWFITGLLRAIREPTATIGTDPAVTVIYTIGMVSFWIASQSYILTFLKVQEQQLRVHRERNVFKMKIYFLITEIFLITSVSLPFFQLFAGSSRIAENLITSHYCLLAIGVLCLGLVLIPQVIGTFVNDIEQAIKSSSERQSILKPVLKRLKRLQVICITLALNNAPAILCFAFWPFLQISGSSYWLPMVTVSCAAGQIVQIYTISPSKKRVSENDQAAIATRTAS